ncbi:hypothetical protein [Streptomyces sp. NBC_01306]|uniref:hypothetical protein n=1 Tax=Streptomyces sp. NBC_01306 TaxID=2903819 RepID=UPI00225BA596|nr:hypothetical protein [Streptomyces sp. NBC_01306]MCX4725986.1 ATP-binding protein [Streptomyces sp. NBC_01306]
MLHRLRSLWRETPSVTRRLCVVMPATGGLLIAVGLAGDAKGWWEGYSFLTNLVSSLTGLMFAVPFALVVLSRLSETHAELAERRAAIRFGERTVRNFLAILVPVKSALRDELMAFVHPDRSDMQQLLDEIKEKLRQYDAILESVEERWRVVSDQAMPRLAEVGMRLEMESSATRYVQAVGSLSQLKSYVADIHVAPPGSSGTHLVHDGGRGVVGSIIAAIDELPTSARFRFTEDGS